jgi:hypothetical protein
MSSNKRRKSNKPNSSFLWVTMGLSVLLLAAAPPPRQATPLYEPPPECMPWLQLQAENFFSVETHEGYGVAVAGGPLLAHNHTGPWVDEAVDTTAADLTIQLVGTEFPVTDYDKLLERLREEKPDVTCRQAFSVQKRTFIKWEKQMGDQFEFLLGLKQARLDSLQNAHNQLIAATSTLSAENIELYAQLDSLTAANTDLAAEQARLDSLREQFVLLEGREQELKSRIQAIEAGLHNLLPLFTLGLD